MKKRYEYGVFRVYKMDGKKHEYQIGGVYNDLKKAKEVAESFRSTFGLSDTNDNKLVFRRRPVKEWESIDEED